MRLTALILGLVLSFNSWAQYPEQQMSNGRWFTRIVNPNPYAISCYFQDRFNYFAFIVPPNSAGPWYVLQGQWTWVCEY